MKNITLILASLFLLLGCESSTVYSEYVSVDDVWNKDQPIHFEYEAKDTINDKDLYIIVRNDERYPYSNIFLITKMQMPDNNIVVDTLEYEMANPDGSWKGYGTSSNKESKLWYKEKVRFPHSGKYLFSISQAMRNVSEVDGVTNLIGITDVGLQIENHNKE